MSRAGVHLTGRTNERTMVPTRLVTGPRGSLRARPLSDCSPGRREHSRWCDHRNISSAIEPLLLRCPVTLLVQSPGARRLRAVRCGPVVSHGAHIKRARSTWSDHSLEPGFAWMA